MLVNYVLCTIELKKCSCMLFQLKINLLKSFKMFVFHVKNHQALNCCSSFHSNGFMFQSIDWTVCDGKEILMELCAADGLLIGSNMQKTLTIVFTWTSRDSNLQETSNKFDKFRCIKAIFGQRRSSRLLLLNLLDNNITIARILQN